MSNPATQVPTAAIRSTGAGHPENESVTAIQAPHPHFAQVWRNAKIRSTTIRGDTDGRPIERVGKYKTVWQRRDDGRWRVIADTFNFDAPMPAGGERQRAAAAIKRLK